MVSLAAVSVFVNHVPTDGASVPIESVALSYVRLKSSEHDTSKSNADLSIFSGINYFYFVSQSPIK